MNSGHFIRRRDLLPETRLLIACTAVTAMISGIWGVVTDLSREFNISRTFVYMLAAMLKETGSAAFGYTIPEPAGIVEEDTLSNRFMLDLRLEGKCSIESISEIMKNFDIENSSVGSISQNLHDFGSLLPNTLTTDNNEIQMVVYLSDEIFAKNRPILITVDPISSAILKIELSETRTSKDWEDHWEEIENNGYIAECLVCDEGKSLCSAHKKCLEDGIRQPDTYHGIAHQLGKWSGILENSAYKAIEKEYEAYSRLDSARSDSVIEKRIEAYEKAKAIAESKIELAENFNFIYKSIFSELAVFDQKGNLRDRKEAEMNIEAGLSLIEELEIKKLKAPVSKIRRILPELLAYFDIAKSIVEELREIISDEEAIKGLCLAWQWNKGLIKNKKPAARRYCEENEKYCLEFAEGLLQEEFEGVKEKGYKELDRIVQSSSLVECINSIIRPYLNGSKNNITQETLNLIMFYHNHRRYKSGKRKGKTPWEILTGKKQEKQWIDLLFDVVKERKSSSLSD